MGSLPAVDVTVAPIPLRSGISGPVTARTLRRSLLVYLLVVGTGMSLTLSGAPAATALGLGLVFPGGGFWHVSDPLMASISPLVVIVVGGLIWILTGAMFVWPTLWLLTAALAAHHAGVMSHHAHQANWVIWAVPATAASVLAVGWTVRYVSWRRGQWRMATLNADLEARSRLPVAVVPDDRPSELSGMDLALSRYAIDLALQPYESFTGFDVIEQFQLTSLRYQLTTLQLALAAYQRSHTPAFSGYLTEAQRSAITKMTHPKVWGYWFWENLLGNFRLERDPIARDNIMFSGYLAAMLGAYAAATGDDRFDTEGSLAFIHRGRQFRYSYRSVAQAVYDNMDRAGLCLYPCEPNFVYPVCNAIGLAGLAGYDNRHGTDYAERIRERFTRAWDGEFLSHTGRPILMRSSRTGLTLPNIRMAANDAVIAAALRPVLPSIACRTWEVLRIQAIDLSGDGPRLRLAPWERIDPGNYRPSATTTFATLAATASAMGDTEMCNAMLSLVDQRHPPITCGGAARLDRLSVLANMAYLTARVHRPQAPPPGAGPRLAHVDYPDTLVVSAINDAQTLTMTLRPGDGPLRSTPLKFDALDPGRGYRLIGDRVDQEIVADHNGEVVTQVALAGRSRITLVPLA
ncbi:linalool dehydratase/isomerase domain-containing protein [Mycobacteroides abscessus]|uniref:linalool dehydratase/isomerase domain-containing protein n=1 Tax=Mycobacteroides abscessus TaxID=36809 RepID=UPI0009A7FFD0|nr:hypothetical protein [Mycobacteroides abscessus]MDO3070093.1 hypothetical protein [Mycobacteroides abscessus subsp. bolletii]SKN04802.1 Uncharacterised protein [Mycobacteroides abscessus subsp. bolletii]SKX09372.1 Uncharacterised protein [Mycobacteroides abscessus subsp. bolletii]